MSNLPNSTAIDFFLDDNVVHVWTTHTFTGMPDENSMINVLSTAERDRASKFFHKSDKMKYIFRHGILRNILASYFHVEPEKIKYICGNNGKPYIDRKCCDSQLFFNMASSENAAVYAIAKKCRVGINIERIHTFQQMDMVVEQQFSPLEKKLMRTLNQQEQEAFFYKL